MQSALVGIPQPACGEYHVGNTLWGMTLRVDSIVAAFSAAVLLRPAFQFGHELFLAVFFF